MSRMDGIARRRFLKLTAAGAAALALPWSVGARCDVRARGRVFSPVERATLEAMAARIVPADADAGAREAGVVDYIERLLTAFDFDPPWVFAAGPFSGRAPFPARRTGSAATTFPENRFVYPVALSRTQEIAWRARLYGSANTHGAGVNDGVLGATPGLIDIYLNGLGAIDAFARGMFGRPLAELRADEQDRVLAGADETFVRQVAEHTVEGMYAAPEYGGNRGLAGWRAISYEGDSQPLGYSIFDESRGTYSEIASRPVSRPDAGDVPGFAAETLAFLSAIVAGAGGKRFF